MPNGKVSDIFRMFEMVFTLFVSWQKKSQQWSRVAQSERCYSHWEFSLTIPYTLNIYEMIS